MVLRLYNTLTRSKEEFRAQKKGRILYYTCGPTVHDYAHIGNFRTFVVQDVLKRWLRASGYRVRHVMNITDVDEKTMERAARKKISLVELTAKYEKAFFEDLDCLNIERADHYPRVSDNIDAIAEMISELIQRRHAFKDSDGSIYYDINSFEGYGRLSGNEPKRRIRAKMPREDYKAPKNFLLWKACTEESSEGCWSTKVGRGIPGWHIECAALAEKYLGETIDIHSGGVDLIFPHHENEIAEAEGYTGKTFSRYWMHVEHLIVAGEKMSKSLGNFYTLRQVIRRGHDPRALRLLYLKTHYRDRLDFNFEGLKRCQEEIEYVGAVKAMAQGAEDHGRDDFINRIEGFKTNFTLHMDDDLHSERAWALFIDFLGDVKKGVEYGMISKDGLQSINDVIDWVDGVFGILGECRLTP